jgi:hypothetical protein
MRGLISLLQQLVDGRYVGEDHKKVEYWNVGILE